MTTTLYFLSDLFLLLWHHFLMQAQFCYRVWKERIQSHVRVQRHSLSAKRFIEEGAFVFIFGRRQKALDAALADLGPHARAVKGSVSDLADLDRLYAAVKAERGTLDIVFANAGAGSQLPLGEITVEHSDEILDTNVKGSIFTVQKALPLMGPGGSIILTGSSAGTTGATVPLRCEQGGCTQPRSDLGGGPEGLTPYQSAPPVASQAWT
ncbi:NAD(P)-binding protein [Cadophora sp. DSE1049]|nr:NAD(P)-binding protein [Cadophora sp. DSE1049]